jgi:hypothetical protein
MTKSLLLACLLLASPAAFAQSTIPPEQWRKDLGMPPAEATTASPADNADNAGGLGASGDTRAPIISCGPATRSNDRQGYVGTPCK